MQANIKYIAHSGYSLLLTQHYLLFDYFFGELPGAELNNFKHKDIFASHSHSDHFNKKVFSLEKNNTGVRYFLSSDISARHEKAIYLDPYQSHKEEDIEVYAFGSTDIGVSFAVVCEGITIFHAGDLNLWTWKNESTDTEIEEAQKLFEKEIKLIESQFPAFDIAFFPIDPRMRTDYDEGAKIFLERFDVTHFFPMHFGRRINAAKSFKNGYSGDTIVYAPANEGEVFEITL